MYGELGCTLNRDDTAEKKTVHKVIGYLDRWGEHARHAQHAPNIEKLLSHLELKVLCMHIPTHADQLLPIGRKREQSRLVKPPPAHEISLQYTGNVQLADISFPTASSITSSQLYLPYLRRHPTLLQLHLHVADHGRLAQEGHRDGEEGAEQVQETEALDDHADHRVAQHDQQDAAQEAHDAAPPLLAREEAHRAREPDGERHAAQEQHVSQCQHGGVEEHEHAQQQEAEAQSQQ
ncbi:unnamed protein product [Phytophthora lilii]|uniref:Unnamed protein product n=1 Tax=Phytophthora lilii TaxID=2077276 RepID=A0A9W6YLR8_9STRA|nr:unnamed protein product [Phytophthora lilii]